MLVPTKSVIACVCALLFTAAFASAQQATPIKDLIPALKFQCRVIKQMLEHGVSAHDSTGRYNSAGKLCVYLEAQSDPAAAEPTALELYQLLAHMNVAPATAVDRLAALESDAPASEGLQRFYALTDLAKVALEAGDIEKATAYSQEILRIAPQYPKDWNYGNAIYYGHFVLGGIALGRNDLKSAAIQLLAAGATPGSPQLDTFGPNMRLAKDLLAKGQTEPVLQFLNSCKTFWKMDNGQLDQWIDAIHSGKTPNFTPNLVY